MIPENYRGQYIEARNRARLDDVMLGLGYVPYHPALDSGVDVIYYRERDDDLLRVQLKSRPTIDKKYLERQIWVAFPHGDRWYLYLHDELVQHCEKDEHWVHSASWQNAGRYSTKSVAPWLRDWLDARYVG